MRCSGGKAVVFCPLQMAIYALLANGRYGFRSCRPTLFGKDKEIQEWLAVNLVRCENAIRFDLKTIQQEQVDTCCFK
jgi:hypothetical protein